MKKLMAFLCSVLAVLFMNVALLGIVEASSVAVIPIDVDLNQVERAGDFNGYYWDIMIEKFRYPDYELMDDEKVFKRAGLDNAEYLYFALELLRQAEMDGKVSSVKDGAAFVADLINGGADTRT